MSLHKEAGIYCLANDVVLDWMIAFLESLRTYEPERPLIVIPFNDNIKELEKLAPKYNFEFFADEALLKQFDEVGATLRPQRDIHIHRFRTLCCFLGPFEHFVFLDSDIVVLDKLDDLFKAYFETESEFMYYYGGLFDMVYVPGEFRDMMINDYNANGFNAGSFLSSKGKISLEQIQHLGNEAAKIKQNFPASCVVQPFINYCVDMSRLKTQSFHNTIANLGPEWAKYEPIELVDDHYQVNGKRLIYTHWAGFGHNPKMPNRQLFLQYRLKSLSAIGKLKYRLKDEIKYKISEVRGKIARWIKSNDNKLFNWIYTLYKSRKDYAES